MPVWSPDDPAELFSMADRIFTLYPEATEDENFAVALAVIP